MFITDVEQLNSYMQLLREDQLHTVVHYSHRLQYEKLNVGDKRDVETISNNKQYKKIGTF